MRISISKEKLIEAVSATSSIVSGKSTLPILDMILIEAENGVVIFRSTDLEKTIFYSVGADVSEAGKVVVDGKTLKGVVESVPQKDKKIEFEKVGQKIKVFTESFSVLLYTGDVEDFPNLPSVQKDFFMNVSLADFTKSIDDVSFSVTTDMARPILGGVLFDLGQDGILSMVTTDSYRLSKTNLKVLSLGGERKNLIIPAKTLREIKNVFSYTKKDSNLEIKTSGGQIEFSVSGVSVVARLLDGDYPDYKAVVPKEFKTEVVLPKEDLENSSKLSSFFYENISITNIKVSVVQKKVSVSSTGKKGEGIYDISPKEISGDDVEVFLNSKYLLDVLRSISGENVKIFLNGKFSPCKFSEEFEKDEKFYIIMPLKE